MRTSFVLSRVPARPAFLPRDFARFPSRALARAQRLLKEQRDMEAALRRILAVSATDFLAPAKKREHPCAAN